MYSGLQIRCIKSTLIDSTCFMSSPNPMSDLVKKCHKYIRLKLIFCILSGGLGHRVKRFPTVSQAASVGMRFLAHLSKAQGELL